MKFLDKFPVEYRPQVEWLLEKGGPIVRYRTLKDIVKRPGYCVALKRARKALTDSPLAGKYLALLKMGALNRDVHGSFDYMLENTFGKLSELGLGRGHPEIDKTAMHYLRLANDAFQVDRARGVWVFITDFYVREVMQLLNIAGYQEKQQVDYTCALIDRLAEFIEADRFDDFNIPYDGYPNPGKSYGRHKLINPRFYNGATIAVPLIYDLHGFAKCQWLNRRKKSLAKVEKIVEFILSRTYQAFPPGFGNVYDPERKSYNTHGWKANLEVKKGPGPGSSGLTLLTLESLAQFRTSWKNKHFIKELHIMDGFRGDDGIWRFPKEFLRDGTGYWVVGGRMALESPPRTKEKLALESTFRALAIHFGDGRG